MAGIIARVVTPEFLQEHSLPFSFSVRASESGSVEVSITLEPRAATGGDPSCKLHISTQPIPKDRDLTFKELLNFIQPDRVKKVTEITVPPNRRIALPKTFFLSRRDADCAVLRVDDASPTVPSESYYIPIGRHIINPNSKQSAAAVETVR